MRSTRRSAKGGGIASVLAPQTTRVRAATSGNRGEESVRGAHRVDRRLVLGPALQLDGAVRAVAHPVVHVGVQGAVVERAERRPLPVGLVGVVPAGPDAAALPGGRRHRVVRVRRQGLLGREDDRLEPPDRVERGVVAHRDHEQRRGTLRVTCREQAGFGAQAEVVDHRVGVVRELLPGVAPVRRGIGVAVAAEVERPHAPPSGDEPFGDGLPHHAVEAGRVREQDRVAGAAPVVDREREPRGGGEGVRRARHVRSGSRPARRAPQRGPRSPWRSHRRRAPRTHRRSP